MELRVAIVHYWLVGMRGGERVLERILDLYPNADIYTHAYVPERVSDRIRASKVRTTFIQKLPGAAKHYQKYLPLMPRALEALDMSAYDLVISSEAGPAKGIIANPDAAHVCYCHSPMRYLWDQAALYRENAGLVSRLGMDLFSHGLRMWDVTSAQRVDGFMANSNFVANRIRKYYRRESSVVFPPVNVEQFNISRDVEPHYLWLGQMTAYKRPSLAIEAFNRLGLPLLMVGDGELEPKLRAQANSNIKFAKNLSFAELQKTYATARGLIFTAEEDFGIVPVEMMASGRPVLAYQRGGALDTVTDNVSGRFFEDASVDGLIAAIQGFERFLGDFSPQACKDSVARFAPAYFDAAFRANVDATLDQVSNPGRAAVTGISGLKRAAE